MYLPRGTWYSIHDKQVVEGGKTVSLNAPLDFIPVLQRAGSVVPLQTRLRRSASQMARDPFTLRVIADEEGRASGRVFHDARDGYGYERGEFAEMRVTLEGNVLANVRVAGTMHAENRVERVVLRLGRVPAAITIVADGATRPAQFSVDAETKEVTIRKPEIRVTEEWKIVMEWGVCCRCVAWVVVDVDDYKVSHHLVVSICIRHDFHHTSFARTRINSMIHSCKQTRQPLLPPHPILLLHPRWP